MVLSNGTEWVGFFGLGWAEEEKTKFLFNWTIWAIWELRVGTIQIYGRPHFFFFFKKTFWCGIYDFVKNK